MRVKRISSLGMFPLIVIFWGGLGWHNDASAQWTVGADLVVAIPMNDFADVSDTGTGLGLRGQYRIRNFPNMSLRADGTFITYQYDPYSAPGFLIETRTQSIRFTIGPQFSAYYRRTEFYLAPKYGLYYFYTHDDLYDIFGNWWSETRNNNTEFGWNIHGGVSINIYRMPKKDYDLALNVGGSWHSVRNGFKIEIETEEDPIEARRDVEEFCIHAGLLFLFR